MMDYGGPPTLGATGSRFRPTHFQNGRPWKCTFSSILSDLEVHFLVDFKDLLRSIHSTSTAKDISTAVL